MTIGYDQIIISVVTENETELHMYFKLFSLLLEGKITKSILAKDHGKLETDKFILKFYIKSWNMRGCRSHYALNLTQDKDFQSEIVPKLMFLRDMLDKEKWNKLF